MSPSAKDRPSTSSARCRLEHRFRPVDAHRLARAEHAVRVGSELTRPAPEVGHARRVDRLHEREQVEERCRPLRAEPVVLVGVPGVVARHSAGSTRVSMVRRVSHAISGGIPPHSGCSIM